LVSYLNSLLLIKQFPAADIAKGKMVIDESMGFKKIGGRADVSDRVRMKWKPPDMSMAKLNVDGSFSGKGNAGIGMILRSCTGDVILAACRQVRQCQDALEAELMAIEEGLLLSQQWSTLQLVVESDCADAVDIINGTEPNISAHAFKINVIRELLSVRGSRLVKISRDINHVSHELAKLGRVQGRTQVWLCDFPPEIATVLARDCTTVNV
jgi:ribonuclease HI